MSKKWGKRVVDIIYIVVAVVTVGCLVREIVSEDFYHSFLCTITLMMFALPWAVEMIFHVKVGTGLKLGVWWLMFGSEILGEMENFYGRVPVWDTLLHTTSGFLAAGLGLSLAMLMSGKKDGKSALSPLLAVMFAVTFSVMTSVVWEFCEFAADQVVLTDGQKDRIISTVSSVRLNPEQKNKALVIREIDKTVMYDRQGRELYEIEGGFLDIGIIDTMKDMFVNMVGALAFAWGAYGYLENARKRRFVGWFLIKNRR